MPRLYFEESPVIAAVKTAEELKSALSSYVEIVFLLHATLSNLSRRMELAREAGKKLFITWIWWRDCPRTPRGWSSSPP